MTCSCPKCKALIDFDSTEIQSDGFFSKCAECGTSFVIRKESFARRALHKSDGISCAECGDHPGSSIYCQSCHAIYPDFLVIETSSTAKRGFGKLLAAFNILKHLKIGGTAQPSLESYSAAPARPAKGLSLQGKPALLGIIAVIVITAAGGGYHWYQTSQEEEYASNFVRNLLVIKMGRDLDIKISSRLAADMKTGTSSALTAEELKSAASVKNDADTVMKRIDKVPDTFTASNDSLKKLYDTYSQLNATVTLPAGSADIYSGAVKKIDDDFMKTARELKNGLPEKLSEKLSVNTKKFKELQDI